KRIREPFERVAILKVALFDPGTCRSNAGQQMSAQRRTQLPPMSLRAVERAASEPRNVALEWTYLIAPGTDFAGFANSLHQARIGWSMVGAGHHQDRAAIGKNPFAFSDLARTCDEALYRPKRQIGSVRIAMRQIRREDGRAVERLPPEAVRGYILANATPQDRGFEAEAGQYLRQLCDMAKLIGQITDVERWPEAPRGFEPDF